MNKELKYFSLFDGIGGFPLGISNAAQSTWIQRWRNNQGLPYLKRSHLPSKPFCVGYSEIDKYAIQIHEKQFRGQKNYGDCKKIKWEDAGEFDLLLGGFPCQSFSIAGKRGGFNDTRGTLFFEIVRCLRKKRPRLFLLENVKGLLSHNKRQTFLTILTALDELGYDCQWQVLNSQNFGVPHTRERVFIVGHLRGTPRPEVFPIFETTKNDTENFTKRKKKVLSVKANHFTQNGRNVHNDGYAFALTNDRNDSCVITDIRARKLTPIECERIQGFPDGWTEGISDSQRYKCLGNAVTVNVVEAIMNRLL